jgi:hypothetical protein
MNDCQTPAKSASSKNPIFAIGPIWVIGFALDDWPRFGQLPLSLCNSLTIPSGKGWL